MVEPIPVEKITINLFTVNKEFRVSGYRVIQDTR